MTLGERIKERRHELGLTLNEISIALGVKEATVQRYESGEIKTLKYDTIVNLADILKTTPAVLMDWETKKIAPTVWSDEQAKLNIELFSKLSDEKKDEALRYLRYLASLQEVEK